MREALEYSTEYHKLVEQHLGFKSRIGIHAGVVIMHSNDKFFVSRGAKPIEVEGIQKSVCARIMSLSLGGQTLLSDRAGQIAMSSRNDLVMRDIGKWQFKGVKNPMQLYCISWDKKRLIRPKGNDKVILVVKPKLTPKQLNILRLKRYGIPFSLIVICYWGLIVGSMLEFAGKTDFPATEILRDINDFSLSESISSFFESCKKLFKYL